MGDHRDSASDERWWVQIDEGRMRALADFGDGDEEWVPITLEVCDSCGGRGKYVNPNIDRYGLTQEDFDEDPEFEEMYFRGGFDVQCEECQGMRVVPHFAGDYEIGQRIEALIADRHTLRAEYESEMRYMYGPNY